MTAVLLIFVAFLLVSLGILYVLYREAVVHVTTLRAVNAQLQQNYQMFSQKPVMTLLNEQQFLTLARVVTAAVQGLSKAPEESN